MVLAGQCYNLATDYEAYDRYPLDEPDEWGDLASFHEANLVARQEMLSEERMRQVCAALEVAVACN